MNSENKVALITGGAQGIGKAIVNQLIRESMQVFFLDRDQEAGTEIMEEMNAPKLSFLHGDVAEESFVQQSVEQVYKQTGRIDFLVNNAAIHANRSISELSLEAWNQVIAVNLTAPFLLAKHCAPFLKLQQGAIINISSTRAMMSEPDTEAYSASKGGIFALTHSLAISLGPEISVNCISPGWIDVTGWQKKSERKKAGLTKKDHQQHPAGRAGQPEDVASMVSFLLKPENDFITGQNFVVDGGMSRKMIYEE